MAIIPHNPLKCNPQPKPQEITKVNFDCFVPERPYCTDWKADGLQIKGKDIALRHRYLQFNDPNNLRWMVHDIDHENIYFLHDEENLPQPNLVIFNGDNVKAHTAYLIKTPVWDANARSIKPLRWLAAIERGYRRRMRADMGYAGFIAKNPLHDDFRTEWRRPEPYTLSELDRWLEFEDKRHDPKKEDTYGYGRNCQLFFELRQIAYKTVIKYKLGGNKDQFFEYLMLQAMQLNSQLFGTPLFRNEVRATTKSVTKWTWNEYRSGHRFLRWKERNELQFRERQRRIARLRWKDHVSNELIKPWDAEGMSRATWYRRK